MHRGSSKGDRPTHRPPETLPLSASPDTVCVTLTLARAGRTTSTHLTVPPGTTLRAVLRSAGYPPEGCAVLVDGVPWPLDRAVLASLELTVLPTFSGG